MRNYIDENDKKNEIRLLFKHPLYKGKVICIVEGGSDLRLFRRLLNYPELKVESIDGKKDLLKVMAELSVEYPEQILSICDADHDHLMNLTAGYEDLSIFVTDYHDAETLMISSPSFQRFLSEFSKQDMLDVFKDSLLEKVISVAYPIGLLRWLNTEECLNLRFKGLNFNEFVDVSNFNIDVDLNALCQTLIRRSVNKKDTVTEAYLMESIERYTQKNACSLQVCNGHDLTNIISVVYRNKWASLETNIDNNKVESALRIGFGREFFFSTNLGKSVSDYLSKLGLTPH